MINWKRLAFNLGLLLLAVTLPAGMIWGLFQIPTEPRSGGDSCVGLLSVCVGLMGIAGVFGSFFNLVEGDAIETWLKEHYKKPATKKHESKEPSQTDWR